MACRLQSSIPIAGFLEILVILAPAPAHAQRDCASVASLILPHAAILSAEVVPATPAAAPATPAYCRVKAEATPTSDSKIGFEVWMPVTGWNGKFLQQGNGGLAGSINYPPMQQEIRHNYAVAATDDGHTGTGTDGSWALGHPEKVVDFGYRAVHETAEKSKLIIAAFYGHGSRYSYFAGCSEGGREAMMEAQRFPDDFNGILVGSPAADWTGLMEGFAWNAQALLKDPASYIPESKRSMIEAAALKACGTQGDITDPFIKDPLSCHFDPAPLLCKQGDGDACLTAPQLIALEKIYAGSSNPRTGQKLYPGYEPGAEAEPGPPGLSYSSYIYGPKAPMTLNYIFSTAFLGSAVFNTPNYSSLSFNFDKDVATVSATIGVSLEANNPDLRAFKAHGGKMLHYHGWYDGSPSPMASVDYYRAVTKAMGDPNGFYRLYMVPGMMHCGLGPGPNAFGNLTDTSGAMDPDHNIFTALKEWVEAGRSPDSVIASKFPNDDGTKPAVMTRPLCPFPQQAVWNKKGKTSDASSFTCSATQR